MLPGVSNLICHHDSLVVAGSYVTVFFLVYFPVGVLVPTLRPWAAAMSISFHVAIALFMGLTGFTLTMIALRPRVPRQGTRQGRLRRE
ncbi:hypothetical protein [Streptomyces sp. NPDC001450]